MRDHDESHPGVARHGLEQGLQGLKPASRAADTKDGKSAMSLSRWLFRRHSIM